MNIDAVKIKNFRNYLGDHEFLLNKKITILYGSNGFGKSSFFDAIEWCLTGEISRYDKSFNKTGIINHNCNFENAECCVEIIFGGNILSRSFKVVDSKIGRVSVKITPKSGKIIHHKDNVDNFLKHAYVESEKSDLFGSLIKQSHILSQDQVTEFISKDDPKDRFNSLADIMGLKNVLYLYENFKGIRSEVQNTKLKLGVKKQQNEDKMVLRSKDMIPIGAELIKEIELLIQSSPNAEILEKILPTLEQKKLTIKQNINQVKVALENILQKGYLTVSDAKESANDLRGKIRFAEEHVSKLKQLSSQVQNLNGNITQKSGLMDEITKLNEQINDKLNILEGKGFSESTGISDVAQLAEPKRKRLSKLVYAVSSKLQYQTLLRETHRSEEIPVLINKEDKLHKKAIRLNYLINHINSILNDSEDGVIVKLLQDIQNIQSYVKLHNTDGICPVCSAQHGDNLHSVIASNIILYDSLVNEKTSRANRLMDMKIRFEKSKSDIDIKLSQTKNELSKLQLSIENAQQQLSIFKSNSLFDDKLFSSSLLNQINEENERVKNEINQLNTVTKNIEDIIQLKNKRTTKQSELGTRFVGDLTKDATENRKRRLKRAESRMKKYIKNKQDQIKDIQNHYNTLFVLISKIPEYFKEDEYKIPIVDLLTSNRKQEEVIERELKLLSKAVELKRTLIFNEKVSGDIAKFQVEQESIDEQLSRCNDVLESTKTFVDNIGGALGIKAKDFLNTSQSLIQKYYRYLNPLPSNNVIKFDGENGELNIIIPLKDETKFSNVNHTLSSGQLNVLAIAIFLAINESQKISQLDFVAIDDPIQNMDDVNQFAICDVLGSLKKQLIFSTHDLDFVKLFIKKNDHLKSEIQLYMLESPQLQFGKIKRMDFITS
jgi:exonuclease SbcC